MPTKLSRPKPASRKSQGPAARAESFRKVRTVARLQHDGLLITRPSVYRSVLISHPSITA